MFTFGLVTGAVVAAAVGILLLDAFLELVRRLIA